MEVISLAQQRNKRRKNLSKKAERAIEKFKRKKKKTFYDFIILQSKRDKFSGKRKNQLLHLVPQKEMDKIKKIIQENNFEHSIEKELITKAMRWFLRGLSSENACKKVLTDIGVSREERYISLRECS